MELHADIDHALVCRKIGCRHGRFMCLYFRILLIMYYLSVLIPDKILRCAQDDNPLRGKERGKEGGCAAFFSLLPPDNWLSS
jgi:hypothetical protein